MKLQIALDDVYYEGAKQLLEKVRDSIDIIEIGTPFAYSSPISLIGELKWRYPEKKILADYKIMDGGEFMAGLAYRAGADITTVSARAHDETIEGAVRAAKAFGREILVDMMAVPLNEIEERTRFAASVGADYICVHTSLDVANAVDPLASLGAVRLGSDTIRLSVAGGINLNTIDQLAAARPDVVIVGGALVKARDPEYTARELKARMEKQQ
jgi:3-hexulose-6-phosphate synthase